MASAIAISHTGAGGGHGDQDSHGDAEASTQADRQAGRQAGGQKEVCALHESHQAETNLCRLEAAGPLLVHLGTGCNTIDGHKKQFARAHAGNHAVKILRTQNSAGSMKRKEEARERSAHRDKETQIQRYTDTEIHRHRHRQTHTHNLSPIAHTSRTATNMSSSVSGAGRSSG